MSKVKRHVTWFPSEIGGDILEHVVRASDFDATQSDLAALLLQCGGMQMDLDERGIELAALREELAQAESMRKFWANSAVELDKRLTAAEQRNEAITELLRQAATYGGLTPLWHDKVQRFIKPTESGASES